MIIQGFLITEKTSEKELADFIAGSMPSACVKVLIFHLLVALPRLA